MVISKQVVGTMVRQTALNICRRKRLENDRWVILLLNAMLLSNFYNRNKKLNQEYGK